MVVYKIPVPVLSQDKKRKVCSLISDETQDESKLEAQCVILRYLEESPSGLRPVERLSDCREGKGGDRGGKLLQ